MNVNDLAKRFDNGDYGLCCDRSNSGLCDEHRRVAELISEGIREALTEADLMRAAAVEDAVHDVAKIALELIDVVDGSGGGMLDVEPYKSNYAKLKDLGAAPSGGNHAKEAEQAGGQEILAQGEEAVVRESPAVRPDAEPNADDGRG